MTRGVTSAGEAVGVTLAVLREMNLGNENNVSRASAALVAAL